MTRSVWLASTAAATLWLGLALPAVAQDTPGASVEARQDPERPGVLIFDPAFFADTRPRTALDMVQRLPGFGLNGGSSGTRGLAGTAGNVLIDGRHPSTKSEGLDSLLSRVSADSVAYVELIRGGAPGIDMQGRSVVANVVLKDAVTVERVLGFDAYVYEDGYIGPVVRAEYSRRAGDHQIEGAISATVDRTDGTNEGRRQRFDPSGALIQDAEIDSWDRFRNVRASGAIQRPQGGGLLRVNAVTSYFNNDQEQDIFIRSGAGDDDFSEQGFEELSGEIGARWTRPLGLDTELELTGLQRLEASTVESGFIRTGRTGLFTSDSTAGETIGRGVVRYRRDDRWSYEGGAEIAYNFLDTDSAYEENGVPIALPGAAVLVEELRGEASGQATWRPGPNLTVEAGLRVEVSEIRQSGDTDSAKSFIYPKPRLLVTWTPMPDHQFRFRIERQVGQLDFGDFAASAEVDLGQVEAGNADLEPSKTTAYEAVYERRFWDEGVVSARLTHTGIEDYIDVIPLVGGFEALGNIGTGTRTEFEVQTTLPTDRAGIPGGRLIARAAFRETDIEDPLTGESRRFSGDDGFGCGVTFTQDLDGGRWAWGMNHSCDVDAGTSYRVRELRFNEAEPPFNAFVQWKPSDDLSVRVDFSNLTDAEQRRRRDIYAGPRDSAPLSRRETSSQTRGSWLFLQIRKTI